MIIVARNKQTMVLGVNILSVAIKYGGFIDKIAKKSVKIIKKKEVQKVKDARASKKDA